MNRLISGTIFFVLSLVITQIEIVQGEQLKQKELEKELISVIQAPYEGDEKLILKHTFPPVMQFVGGEKKFKEGIKYLSQTLEKGGVTFHSATVEPIYSYVTTETEEVFLVDVELILNKGEDKLAHKLTQIAIKEKGAKHWKYIDSSGVNDKLLHLLLPNLPDDFTLQKKAELKNEPTNFSPEFLAKTWFVKFTGEIEEQFLTHRNPNGSYSASTIYLDHKGKRFAVESATGKWKLSGNQLIETDSQGEALSYQILELTKEKLKYQIAFSPEDVSTITESSSKLKQLPEPPKGYQQVEVDEIY